MKNLFSVILYCFLQFCNAQLSDFNTIDFTIAENIAKINEGEKLNNLPLLSYKLTHKLSTDAEKFRAIYYWVCHNISVDQNLASRVIHKRKKYHNSNKEFKAWNKNRQQEFFKKLLKRKKTMCTGFAYLVKELANLANIECVIVNGYSRTPLANVTNLEIANHSWNAVKLNNKWYLCDPTWSSGYSIDNYFVRKFNSNFFLTSPELFAKNHFPINKRWLLTTSTTSEEFVNAPLIYNEAFKYKVNPVYPKDMEVEVQKNEIVNFKLQTANQKNKQQIKLVYFSGDEERELKINNLRNDNGTLSFESKFDSKGFRDVHLKIDNDIVVTYAFNILNNR